MNTTRPSVDSDENVESDALAAEPLQLTIDLSLEIKNITEKQHLNDVHYAVQLVRHALLHRAPAIKIRSTKRTFSVEHEGDALNPDERDLIFVLLAGDSSIERQAALTHLERRFGVALLSLLVTEPKVEVFSDSSFVAENGVLRRLPATQTRGCRIVVHRRRKSLADERRELSFYCRCCDVPVQVNGRPIKREAIGFSNTQRQLLRMEFQAHAGKGTIGLPAQGMLSRTRYYKHGIYFGLRQNVPSDSLPIDSAFNALSTTFEENFRSSVKAGGAAINAARDALLQSVVNRYGTLERSDQRRVKNLLLGMAKRRWNDALRDVPLFDSGACHATLSLRDLEKQAASAGFVAWVPRSEAPRHGPRSQLPVLLESDVLALSRLLDVPLRRALGPALAPTGGLRSATDHDVALADNTCPLEIRRLLLALQAEAKEPSFVVTASSSRAIDETAAGRIYCIPLTDPALHRAAAVFEASPDRLDVIRASLMA